MSVELDLSGRRALITGAGQGVGRGLALTFAAAGAEVLVNDVRAERAEAVAHDVRETGGAAVPITFDVTNFPAVSEAIAAAGRVDVLDPAALTAADALFATSAQPYSGTRF